MTGEKQSVNLSTNCATLIFSLRCLTLADESTT